MLVVSRKENESISIEPIDGLDPKLTLGEVFARGPILVRIVQCGSRTRLAIDAPRVLKILRVSAPIGPSDLERSQAGANARKNPEHAI
jgi:sRNA-binding carbon storage regulator CsrA